MPLPRFIALQLALVLSAVTLAVAPGCKSAPPGASTGGVELIRGPEPDDRNLIFVDVEDFSVRQAQRGDIDQMAIDFARSVGAQVAHVRITDQGGPAVTFSVVAYKRR